MFSRSDRSDSGSPQRCPLPPQTRLSEAVARYLLDREQQDDLRLSTLALYRQAAWSLIEFLKADPTIGELPQDLPTAWLQSLRTTPWGLRRRGAYPQQFTPGSVSAFLAWPPRSHSSGQLRSEQTIGRFWRHGRPILEWLGLGVRLPKKQRPKLRLPPPWVPTKSAIADRWRDVWAGKTGKAEPADRRRVILMQGLILGSGMRIEEALVAQREWMEGHWLLILDSKTHQPRIIYLTAQLLGIVEALKPSGQTIMPWAADRWQRVSSWPWSKGRWHRVVASCGLSGKTHQELRRRLTTWMRAVVTRHGIDPAVECAQLGHGSGVVIESYLGYLPPLRRVMQRFRLPAVEGFSWPEPIEASAAIPERLYMEFRRIINTRD